MALIAKQLSLFLLLTLLSTLHARDSQFFNKIPSTTTTPITTTTKPTATLPNAEHLPNNEQLQNQQVQEPDFNNENSYGLYSHEAGQLPPSTTTTTTQVPLNKHLPKNYNPVAYVTVPEDDDNNNNNSEFTDEKSFSTNPTRYNNNNVNQNYYNNFQQQQEEEPNYENNNDNYNYDKFNYMRSFNSQPQGRRNGYQPQGMSDTRFMENGKYFYDVNNDKYSNNHPYETLKGVQPRNFYGNNGNGNEFSSNKNFYGNRGNGNEFDSVNYMGGNGYESQAEFQNEENYNMP